MSLYNMDIHLVIHGITLLINESKLFYIQLTDIISGI